MLPFKFRALPIVLLGVVHNGSKQDHRNSEAEEHLRHGRIQLSYIYVYVYVCMHLCQYHVYVKNYTSIVYMYVLVPVSCKRMYLYQYRVYVCMYNAVLYAYVYDENFLCSYVYMYTIPIAV